MLAAVVEKRATFTRWNVLAEAHRQLHSVRLADPADRIGLADRITDRALPGTAMSHSGNSAVARLTAEQRAAVLQIVGSVRPMPRKSAA